MKVGVIVRSGLYAVPICFFLYTSSIFMQDVAHNPKREALPMALIEKAIARGMTPSSGSKGYPPTNHVPNRTPPLQRKFEKAQSLVQKGVTKAESILQRVKPQVFIKPLSELPLPKVFATHWQDVIDYQVEEWNATVYSALKQGYNGMYVVLGHDATQFLPNQVANIVSAYLAICAQYKMEFHLAFGAIEGTHEISHTSTKELATGVVKGMQRMWSRGANARSELVEEVVRTCSSSPYSAYFQGVTIMQEPQFLSNLLSKSKYERAIWAIAQRIWEINPRLEVMVKPNHASLESVGQVMTDYDEPRIVRGGHLFAGPKASRWTADEVRQAVQVAPVGTWISMLHFANYNGTDDEKAFFLTHALDAAVRRKVSVGMFGFCEPGAHGDGQHAKHGLFDECRARIAEKIAELRRLNLLAPQLS